MPKSTMHDRITDPVQGRDLSRNGSVSKTESKSSKISWELRMEA